MSPFKWVRDPKTLLQAFTGIAARYAGCPILPTTIRRAPSGQQTLRAWIYPVCGHYQLLRAGL